MNKEDLKLEFQNKVRDAVLETLDNLSPSTLGWNDNDLPDLFPAIDRHSERLFERLLEQDYI